MMILALVLSLHLEHQPIAYDVFTPSGMHLVMSDNGTESLEDDFVVDWDDGWTVTID